jgi:hypothetical protein
VWLPALNGERAHAVAGRIFISYSQQEPQPTRDVATFLTSEGYSV